MKSVLLATLIGTVSLYAQPATNLPESINRTNAPAEVLGDELKMLITKVKQRLHPQSELSAQGLGDPSS